MRKRDEVILVVGYAFGFTAFSTGYLTAFGASSTGVGYVAETLFTVVSNVVSLLVCAVLAILSSKGRLAPQSMSYNLPSAIMFCAFLLVQLGVFDGVDPNVTFVILGICNGVAYPMLSICWLELFVIDDGDNPIMRLAIAFVLAYAIRAGIYYLPALAGSVLAMLFLTVGVVVIRHLREVEVPFVQSIRDATVSSGPDRGSLRNAIRMMAAPFSALFVMEAVVGMVNMSSVGNSFEFVMSGLPVWAGSFIASGILAIMVILTRRTPNPTTLYRLTFPVIMAALLILPFITSASVGKAFGSIMVTCYSFMSLTMTFLMVDVCRRDGTSVYALMGFSNAASTFFLLLGFLAGDIFTHITNGGTVTLDMVEALVSIYLISMVLLLISRTQRKGRVADDGVVTDTRAIDGATASTLTTDAPTADAPVPMIAEELFDETVATLSEKCQLTRREGEVLSYLVRGWGAAQIASELSLSQSTVWGHVNSIHDKLGVHTKQETINIFERAREGIAEKGKRA